MFFLHISLLSVLLITINYFLNNILNTEKLLYDSLFNKLTGNQLNQYFEFKNKWRLISYIFIPFFYILKTSLITSTVSVGAYFFCNKEVKYKYFWSVIVKGEYIYLLVGITKIIWFYFFQPNFTIEDIQYFYPLSALNITGYKGLDPWLIYPFQVLNIFELAYIIYLSYQIGYLTKTNADNGLKIVCYSYLPALLLWVTVVMFFTLNYS
ncbi:hypothetical protein DB895_10960 [Flavobacterium psychrotolerans]|uniref:Yip1 domain-containing protein n=2 Tax=Flavobacterium psychrotolerans TaxID=2169410 RepID=A0A2U1JHT2_9FLAO|nr:hypothetical protein DB895_10960 [Flavobacterium psychrotolerans]